MSSITPADVRSPDAAATPVVIAVPKAMAWLFATTVAAMVGYYFIGVEQGATSIFSGAMAHEFVHDARHFIGFPCH